MPTPVRDPRAEVPRGGARALPQLEAIAGKTLALLSNGWTSMDRIAARLGEGLKARYGVKDVLLLPIPISTPAENSLIDTVLQRADFAVVGLAN